MGTILKRWAPALVLMAIIFALSSQPSDNLPNFNWLDRFVKKGGHFMGYGLLALTYLRGFSQNRQRYWLAWIFTVLFAITDEIHQSFVPGRRASTWDVLLFDNLGAAAALSLYYYGLGKSRIPVPPGQKTSASK